MLTPENTEEFMNYLDNYIDTLINTDNLPEQFLLIGSLTSMAFARVHLLPLEMRLESIRSIKKQLEILEQLHLVVNPENSELKEN